MNSPLFNMFGNNNPMQMINDFNKFKNTFKGNPQQEVQNMLSAGMINQQQLNQVQSMAQKFQEIMNAFNH